MKLIYVILFNLFQSLFWITKFTTPLILIIIKNNWFLTEKRSHLILIKKFNFLIKILNKVGTNKNRHVTTFLLNMYAFIKKT